MSQLSFTHVPLAGFSAFGAHLLTGVWALVDSSAYEDPAKPLWDAPTMVVVKVRLHRQVQGLLQAIAGAGGAKACDRAWDGCQKHLNRHLRLQAISNDPAKQQAVTRLQNLLLLGAGEGQTQLRYHEEVDFGRKQMLLVSQGQAATDVQLLGLGPIMAEIALATDALAAAIGYGETSAAPHLRRSKSTIACVTTFGWAAETLGWMIEHGGNSAQRELALSLHASLVELVERYSVSAPISHPQEASPPSVH